MSPSFDIHESHYDLLSWMLESHRRLLKHNKTWEDSTREPERLYVTSTELYWIMSDMHLRYPKTSGSFALAFSTLLSTEEITCRKDTQRFFEENLNRLNPVEVLDWISNWQGL